MKNYKTILILSLLVILMSVFGNVMAQDEARPAVKVASVDTDEKVVLVTKDFPAATSYIVYMASSEAPENFTAVAKFNSNSGGKLSITIKIPAKFQGLKTIELKIEDEHGGVIPGSFVNIPEEPAAEETSDIELVNEETVNEEPAAEETSDIELVNEETVKEEPTTEETTDNEPVNEETVSEEPAVEETVNEEPAAEETSDNEPVKEETVSEDPAAEETSGFELVNEETVNEEPAAEETSDIELVNKETVSEEPAAEETSDIELVNEETVSEEPAAAEPVKEETTENNAELVCDFSRIPSVTITGVVKNESVTFVTANFPANSQFSVSMGYYVSTWVPAREPVYGRPHHGNRGPVEVLYPHEEVTIGDEVFYVIEPIHPDAPDFRKPKDKPGDHRITGYTTSSFSGTQVGTFETGSGDPQTLTFQIPSSLRNVNPIAIWISDLGPCGFYSYNYFYNNSTN